MLRVGYSTIIEYCSLLTTATEQLVIARAVLSSIIAYNSLAVVHCDAKCICFGRFSLRPCKWQHTETQGKGGRKIVASLISAPNGNEWSASLSSNFISGTATSCGLGGRGTSFFPLHIVQTGSATHPASNPMDTGS